MDVIAGRFELLDLVATGGAGAVWRSRDLRSGAVCAAKVLRQRDSADLLRFVREQGVQLEHPHVLTPYGWAAEDTHVVIASRLVHGGTLATMVAEHGPLERPVVADLLDQLLDALGAVHHAGWVHRDVKPANLLLEATGAGWPELSLADFGLAVHADDARLTFAGTVLGTEGYVPPEARTGAHPTPARDLWAAGAVALRLLGADPGDDPGGDPLGRTISRLTHPEPSRRPASADAARALLGHVRPDRPPVTAGGLALHVRDRLPPLGEGVVPVGGPPEAPVLPPTAALPSGTAPLGLVGTRALPANPPTTALPARTPTRCRRVPALLGALALLAAGALAVLASSTSTNTPATSAPPTPSTAPGPTAASQPGLVVTAGAPCSWAQQGDTALTDSGGGLTCEVDGAGYTWS